MDDIGLGYKLRTAATFRGILNDLKRNDEVAAEELGVDTQLLRDILSAKCDLPPALIRMAADIWPVNERDCLSIREDGGPSPSFCCWCSFRSGQGPLSPGSTRALPSTPRRCWTERSFPPASTSSIRSGATCSKTT